MVNHIIGSFSTRTGRYAYVSTTDPDFPFAVIEEYAAVRNIYTRPTRLAAATLFKSFYMKYACEVIPFDETL